MFHTGEIPIEVNRIKVQKVVGMHKSLKFWSLQKVISVYISFFAWYNSQKLCGLN